MTNLLAFLTYMLITAFTPGPNNITSMSNAATYGFKKSWPYNLGMWCAFSVVMILCALFSTVLQTYIPSIKPYLIGAGAAYMLHLAWKTWKAEPPKVGTSAEDTLNGDLNTEQTDSKKTLSLSTRLFLSGAALQFVNPKIIIYGITSLSVYVIPNYSNKAIIALFALLLALVGTTSTVCWALAGSSLRLLFSQHTKIVNGVLAILLLWCTVSLFV